MSRTPIEPNTARRVWMTAPFHDEDVDLRCMFGCPALFHRGKMFACLYGDVIGLKLPRARVAELIGRAGVEPFAPHGKRPMLQWLAVDFSEQSIVDEATLLRESFVFMKERSS